MKGTYTIYVQGYDYGPCVNKIIVSLDKKLDSLAKEDFTITETKRISDDQIQTIKRTIKNIISDDNKTITFDLSVSQQDGMLAYFSKKDCHAKYSVPYQMNLKYKDQIIELDPNFEKQSSIDHFKFDKYTYKNITYKYAYYPIESDTLLIWLHGLGEGGTVQTDATMTIMGNEAACFSYPSFQSLVPCHVLSPQCPTYWMDFNGTKDNLNGGAIVAYKESYYTESLIELIRDYKKKHNIKKTILTGCSNGGYMAMLLSIAYPEEFTCVIPVCEALPDKFITDEDIHVLKDIPMYFYYATNDIKVPPVDHEIPTIHRLKQAGAKNLKVSVFDKVVGIDTDPSGIPYEYSGHRTWIYLYHNISKNEVHPFEWIQETIK